VVHVFFHDHSLQGGRKEVRKSKQDRVVCAKRGAFASASRYKPRW
jgi:hypothetical protein